MYGTVFPGTVLLDVALDRCIRNVLQIENEKYDVIVLVLYRSDQHAA